MGQVGAASGQQGREFHAGVDEQAGEQVRGAGVGMTVRQRDPVGLSLRRDDRRAPQWITLPGEFEATLKGLRVRQFDVVPRTLREVSSLSVACNSAELSNAGHDAHPPSSVPRMLGTVTGRLRPVTRVSS